MQEEIQDKKISTTNIQEELTLYASENFLNRSQYDFTINHIEYYVKKSANEEFRLYNGDLKTSYTTPHQLINDELTIKQSFTITISPKIRRRIKLDYTIDYGEESIFPKIIIEPSSHIPYKKYKAKELFLILVQEINKIKAINKILVNLYDDSMIKSLKIFTKYIYADKFTKNVKITLFNGVEPDITRPSKLIMWYEENHRGHRIKEVESGEVLVEFKKAIYGKNGLNAFGTLLTFEDKENDKDLAYKIDLDTIKIKEDSSKKQYISKLKGFVNSVNGVLTVENKVNVDRISRVEETIVTDQDNNIEVFVSQDDTTKDSVGEGVELISETIHVNGHVGANSRLESINLKVDGATHKGSKQFTKNAFINRHKGNLRCNNAQIKLLEGGEIHATTANIETTLNGTIFAKDVTIGIVKSHLKVYAANSITIDLLEGEDNILKVNYKEIPILNAKIDFIHEEIDDLKYKLQEAKRHNIAQVDAIKEKIKNLRDEVQAIIFSTNHAKITINRPVRGLNTIIFELSNGEQILYKTTTQKYEPFYLEFKDKENQESEIMEIILHPVNKIFRVKI